MGLFKKKNGHKTLFGKIAGGAMKVAGVAIKAGADFLPVGKELGGKVGEFVGKIGNKVSSIQTKVSSATAGQVDLAKLLPQRAEMPAQYKARLTKGLGGAVSGFTQQASIPVGQDDAERDPSENLKAGFVGNRLPSWALYLGGGVTVLLLGYKLLKK